MSPLEQEADWMAWKAIGAWQGLNMRKGSRNAIAAEKNLRNTLKSALVEVLGGRPLTPAVWERALRMQKRYNRLKAAEKAKGGPKGNARMK
jgi:hypothetical protein